MIYMKKIILLIILTFTVISCAEIQALEKNRRDRGTKCVYDYYGNMICGYTRQNRKEQINCYISIKDNVVY